MNNQQEKTLLPEQRRALKKLAHHLKPVVQMGKKGLTDALLRELDIAFVAHELIKMQVTPDNKKTLEADLATILRETGSHHIDTVGNIVILFRKREEDSQFDL